MNASIKALLFAAAVIAVPLAVAAAPARLGPSPEIVLASPLRSEADRALDANRKASQMLSFIGLKPGDHVADVFPGGGYFTRVFATAVGPNGKVYGVVKAPPKTDALTSDPNFKNIALSVGPWEGFKPAEKLDVVFSSQFQHDLYNPEYGPAPGGEVGVDKWNKAVFEALKPDGLFIVVDHAGKAGTGVSEINILHRIEQSAVVANVTKAGFKLVGEGRFLANPGDDRSKNVFDPAIRGKTDQFVLKFQKP